MSSSDYLRFALGALRGHALRTVLSLLGVAVGVAAVIVLTSLGEGARRYVTSAFSSLGSNLVIVIPGKVETSGGMPIFGNSTSDLTIGDAEALPRRIPSIRRVAPLSLGSATARFGERSRLVTVLGTTAAMRPLRGLEVRSGEYLPEVDPDQAPRVCVIGAALQRELFPDSNPLGQILRIGDQRFRVVGVVSAHGTSLGMDMDEVVHVPVRLAMRMFDRATLFRILIEVGSRDDMNAVAAAALRTLRERHDRDDVTVLTQDAVVGSFDRILGILTAALAAIAAVSLGVAGIGIMNVMLVSVSERTAEVGLLKALGATASQILIVFLVESALLASFGCALGLITGLTAARALTVVYPSFPATAPDWAVYGALLIGTSSGLVFGVLPARRAARLDPIAALARR